MRYSPALGAHRVGRRSIVAGGVVGRVGTRRSVATLAAAVTVIATCAATTTTAAATPDVPAAEPQGRSSAATAVVRPTYVVAVSQTATTDDDVYPEVLDEQVVSDVVDDLDEFLEDQTGGRERVRLAGHERLRLDQRCLDATRLATIARQRSFGGRFAGSGRSATPARLIVLTTELGCHGQPGGRAVGAVAVSFGGLGEYRGRATLTHEYLHTLDVAHANGGWCPPDGPAERGEEIFGRGRCEALYYSDMLDAMSSNHYVHQLSAPTRIDRGWLGDDAWVLAATGEDRRLTLRDLGAGEGVRALRVVDPWTRIVYTVEYRTPTGRDASSSAWDPTEGRDMRDGYWEAGGGRDTGHVRVLRREHAGPGDPYTGTVVLPVGAGSPGPVPSRRPWMETGESFSPASGAFRVTVVDAAPDRGATLQLRWPARQSTVTTLRRVGASGRPWTHALEFRATARTAGGQDLRHRRVDLFHGGTRVASGRTGQVIEIREAHRFVGTRRFRAVLAGDASVVKSSATAAARTERLAPRLRVVPQRRGAGRATLRVQLRSPSRRAPSSIHGRVVVRGGDRVLRRAWVGRGPQRTVTVSVPTRRLRPGAPITVRYLGNRLHRPVSTRTRLR